MVLFLIKKKKKIASFFEIHQIQSKIARINNQGRKCPVLVKSIHVVDLKSIVMIKSPEKVEFTIVNFLSILETCLSFRRITNVTDAAFV